jgi:hypothetical protein
MPTELTKKYAMMVLPQLVHYAQMGKEIEYKQLAAISGLPHHRPLNNVLGFIRDEICLPRNLPRINSIVVNKTTHEPGESFLENGTSNLTAEEYTARFREEWDKAILFTGWNDLLNELGLSAVQSSETELDIEAREYNRAMSRRGGIGGEGPRHRALKQFIAKKPQLIDLSALKTPTMEYSFPSADECDVLVDLVDGSYAIVEIKVGDIDGELVKGIYQLIKYKALLIAEKGHGQDIPVQIHLVAYRIPEDVNAFACKFGIRCHVINESIVTQSV